MGTFIKLYDWTTETGLELDERVILSMVTQFTEHEGFGFWGGFKMMADRTGIPKDRCKEIVGKLIAIGAIARNDGYMLQQKRIILTTNMNYVQRFLD